MAAKELEQLIWFVTFHSIKRRSDSKLDLGGSVRSKRIHLACVVSSGGLKVRVGTPQRSESALQRVQEGRPCKRHICNMGS